jgi:hypothetical protein
MLLRFITPDKNDIIQLKTRTRVEKRAPKRNIGGRRNKYPKWRGLLSTVFAVATAAAVPVGVAVLVAAAVHVMLCKTPLRLSWKFLYFSGMGSLLNLQSQIRCQ